MWYVLKSIKGQLLHMFALYISLLLTFICAAGFFGLAFTHMQMILFSALAAVLLYAVTYLSVWLKILFETLCCQFTNRTHSESPKKYVPLLLKVLMWNLIGLGYIGVCYLCHTYFQISLWCVLPLIVLVIGVDIFGEYKDRLTVLSTNAPSDLGIHTKIKKYNEIQKYSRLKFVSGLCLIVVPIGINLFGFSVSSYLSMFAMLAVSYFLVWNFWTVLSILITQPPHYGCLEPTVTEASIDPNRDAIVRFQASEFFHKIERVTEQAWTNDQKDMIYSGYILPLFQSHDKRSFSSFQEKGRGVFFLSTLLKKECRADMQRQKSVREESDTAGGKNDQVNCSMC